MVIMDITKDFGVRLQEIRKARGLTQAQLAESIGLDVKTISRIETGGRFPQKENIEKLVNALNCNVKDLFDFDYIKSKEELRVYIDKILDNAPLNDLKYYARIIDAHIECKGK